MPDEAGKAQDGWVKSLSAPPRRPARASSRPARAAPGAYGRKPGRRREASREQQHSGRLLHDEDRPEALISPSRRARP